MLSPRFTSNFKSCAVKMSDVNISKRHAFEVCILRSNWHHLRLPRAPNSACAYGRLSIRALHWITTASNQPQKIIGSPTSPADILGYLGADLQIDVAIGGAVG